MEKYTIQCNPVNYYSYLGLVASHDNRPGNEVGLFYGSTAHTQRPTV